MKAKICFMFFILIFPFHLKTSFFKKAYKYFFKKTVLKHEYSYNDLPPELLIKILKECDQKIWLKIRVCSKNSYDICSDKSLRYSVQNCVKKQLDYRFFIEDEIYLDTKGFVETLERKHVQRTFDNLYEYLKDYLEKNKKWINNENLSKIRYYFVLYFVRDYILHNKQLNYIKISEYEYWKHGEKPTTLSCLQNCIELLRTSFTFPMQFEVDNRQYFLDVPKTEETDKIYNPWCITMIHGKSDKRNAEIMYYDYYHRKDSGYDYFLEKLHIKKPLTIDHPDYTFDFEESQKYQNLYWQYLGHAQKVLKNYDQWNEKNHTIKSFSLIINMYTDRQQCLYAGEIYKKVFDIIPSKNIQYLTIVTEGMSDKIYWKKFGNEGETSQDFAIEPKDYPHIKKVVLENGDKHSFWEKF